MLSEKVLIEYLQFKIEKVKAIKSQKFDLAAKFRDEERLLSVQLYNIITENKQFESYSICDNKIDDYCRKTYNCSVYQPHSCIKSIKRIKKLRDLGI